MKYHQSEKEKGGAGESPASWKVTYPKRSGFFNDDIINNGGCVAPAASPIVDNVIVGRYAYGLGYGAFQLLPGIRACPLIRLLDRGNCYKSVTVPVNLLTYPRGYGIIILVKGTVSPRTIPESEEIMENLSFIEIMYPGCHDPNGTFTELSTVIRSALFFAKKYSETHKNEDWRCMEDYYHELRGMTRIMHNMGLINGTDVFRIPCIVYRTMLKIACK